MKKGKFLLVAIFCVSMMMLALNAGATIYINEDFESGEQYLADIDEDTTAMLVGFIDRNWVDAATSVTAFGDAEMTMGKMIKAGLNIGEPAPPITKMTKNQGSRTTETFFSGAYSEKLIGDDAVTGTSNTLLMIGNPQNPVSRGWQNTAPYRIWQFAVKADPASMNLPAGTRIGRFRIAFSTNGTTSVGPNASMAINFLVNEKKSVDMVCTTTLKPGFSAKVGELRGAGKYSWQLVTIVQNQGGPARWICRDKDGVFKGPQPLVASPNLTTINDQEWYMMPTGINIFVGRNEQALVLTPTDHLTSKWGTAEPATPVDYGWEMSAANGGVMYFDRFLWVSSEQHNLNGTTQEIANRLAAFNAVSTESRAASAGPSWMLY